MPHESVSPHPPSACTPSLERRGALHLVAWWLAAIGLGTLLLVHFSLLLVGLLPGELSPRPLRAAANVYAAPIFTQTWWFFAPNAPTLDRQAYARGLYDDAAGSRVTDWLPLTEPVSRAVRENRLSPRNAAWNLLSYAMHNLIGEAGLMQLGPRNRERIIGAWADLHRQPPGLVALERAGSAALAAEYPRLAFEQVQVKVTLRRLPSYAERETTVSEGPLEELVFRPVAFQDVASWSPGW